MNSKWTGLANHPLAVRYHQKLLVTGDNRIRTATDVLGERISRLVGVMVALERYPDRVITNLLPDAREDFAASVLRAKPYLWTEEVHEALKTMTIPRHVLSPRLLADASMWWTFETGIDVGGSIGDADGFVVDAEFVRHAGDHLQVWTMGESERNGAPVAVLAGARFRYGATYPDDFSDDENRVLMSVLVMNAFLSSPHIPVEEKRLPRAERREIARVGAPDVGDAASFIILRRPHGDSADGVAEGQLNRRHRWIVSGHFRAQWYPSERGHRVIWIAPHMKGPEDAPLLEHVYKVAR